MAPKTSTKPSSKKSQPKKAPVKKTTSKKEPEPEPIGPPVPVETVPVESTQPVSTQPVSTPPVDTILNYDTSLDALESKLRDATALIKSLTSEVVSLRKQVNKERKVLDKRLKTRPRRNNGEKSQNGFSKPGPVSDELRKFLGMSKEDLIARTEVTKKITEYCQKHKLQNESDKRIILPDKTLMSLLKLKKGQELTYFNLQKYMKVHFPNKEGVYPTLA